MSQGRILRHCCRAYGSYAFPAAPLQLLPIRVPVQGNAMRRENDHLLDSVKKKVCFVTSSEMTVKVFLLGYIEALGLEHDVHVVVNTVDPGFLGNLGVTASTIPVAIERKIHPLKDIAALLRLYVLFRKNRFDVVHSVTPKAGLLAMIAAAMAAVPIRIHTFTGQVWATRSGISRWLLKQLDILIASLATHVLVDSNSQRRFLIEEHVIQAGKSAVLANGSICGADITRFRPNPQARLEVRNKFNIRDSDVVFLYLGRLNPDKGVLDLAEAFAKVASECANVHLMVVGPDEGGMQRMMSNICETWLDRLHFVPYTSSPESYMAASDVFCLPSYREGFGNVIIEAACAGLPAIGSDIYGITDAIEANAGGLLFKAGDVNALASRMLRLSEAPGLRNSLGENAKLRAMRDFSQEKVIEAVVKFYDELLGEIK